MVRHGAGLRRHAEQALSDPICRMYREIEPPRAKLFHLRPGSAVLRPVIAFTVRGYGEHVFCVVRPPIFDWFLDSQLDEDAKEVKAMQDALFAKEQRERIRRDPTAALTQREPIRKPAPAETEFMPPRTFQVRHWESAIVIAMPPREFGDLTTYSRPMASAAARAAVEMLTTRLSLAQLEKMIGELPKEGA